MRLLTLELNGFKSFAKKTVLEFESPIVCVVGPNGSGKSNVVEAVRFVLGEQSMKSMRGKAGADLIWKGSKNLQKGSRASVAIHLDNRDKIFKIINDSGESQNLNYDIVSIGREVYPDGLNKYLLNGSEVRLRDINNLLSSVNIGSSGHHIISQGEADRILNANSKDRREMIEDALGLKVYQYKIKDSERKLERTEANMKEVSLLRRENAPHLNFLRKQVEKLEKMKELESELLVLYREYLKKESIYISAERNNLSSEKNKVSSELKIIEEKISGADLEDSSPGGKKIEELKAIENDLNQIRNLKGEMERKLGRVEGMLESKEERMKLFGKCPLCGSDMRELGVDQDEKRKHDQRELTELMEGKSTALAEIAELDKKEKDLGLRVEELKSEISTRMEKLRDKEREKFSLKVRHQELASALDLIKVKEENLSREEEAFENEIKEGGALCGPEILSYKSFQLEERTSNVRNTDVGRPLGAGQEELRRKIERLKIKLEDSGLGSGADVKKEFEEVQKRDDFLIKEMEDLTKSIASIEKLMVELKEKIDREFKEGIKKINVEFEEFFRLMFGGGTASLSVVVENKKRRISEEESEEFADTGNLNEAKEIVFEQGIEINVSLPHKKVKELHALSGGERSLASIALLFAMSQVNPPPFLVLDETDAALDEANSRKYGDMVEKLSKHSQLVVVTHNRETMSRAGILYGVTIGADGASKLLSVRFDEAVSIAK